MERKTHIVSTEWLHEHLNDPDIVILDASEKEYISGLQSDHQGIQIEGSRYFDLKNKFSEKCDLPHTLVTPQVFEEECCNLGINSTSQIVVYDNLGIYVSPRVWWMFRAMGHDRVAVLDGGLPAWVSDGYTTEPKQDRIFPRGNFNARFRPELVRNYEFIKKNLLSEEAMVVDARSAGRFQGTAPEPRPGLPSGHIPNSLNLPFPEVLKHGKFKSRSELREIFASALRPDKPLVFSCGSGLTACITFLACELISDAPKAVYDGSWTEYAQTKDAPIEKENEQ